MLNDEILCSISEIKSISGLVSSNPCSAHFLSDVWQKSMRHASFVFDQLAKSMWESSLLLWKIVVWSTGVKSRKHMSRWTGRRDINQSHCEWYRYAGTIFLLIKGGHFVNIYPSSIYKWPPFLSLKWLIVIVWHCVVHT